MKILSMGRACLLAAAFFYLCGCSHEGAGEHEPPPVVKGLTVTTAESVAVPEEFEVSGTVKAKNTVRLAARIAGSVSGVFAAEGDRVRRGSLLLSLDALEHRRGGGRRTCRGGGSGAQEAGGRDL